MGNVETFDLQEGPKLAYTCFRCRRRLGTVSHENVKLPQQGLRGSRDLLRACHWSQFLCILRRRSKLVRVYIWLDYRHVVREGCNKSLEFHMDPVYEYIFFQCFYHSMKYSPRVCDLSQSGLAKLARQFLHRWKIIV